MNLWGDQPFFDYSIWLQLHVQIGSMVYGFDKKIVVQQDVSDMALTSLITEWYVRVYFQRLFDYPAPLIRNVWPYTAKQKQKKSRVFLISFLDKKDDIYNKRSLAWYPFSFISVFEKHWIAVWHRSSKIMALITYSRLKVTWKLWNAALTSTMFHR